MAMKSRGSKHVGKNQTSIKAENTSSILRTVHETNDISRADLVRLTGLTAPTVSRIVSFLVAQGVVTDAGSKYRRRTQAGRAAFQRQVALHSSHRFFVGACSDGAHDLVVAFLTSLNAPSTPEARSRQIRECPRGCAGMLNRHRGIKVIGLVSPRQASSILRRAWS